MNDFCIVTCHNDNFKPLADITLPVMMGYASAHGYEWTVERPISSSVPSLFGALQSPEIIWHRLNMIEDALANHKWAVWMDTDTLITNPEVMLESLILPDSHVVLSADMNGLNDGVLFMDNSSWTYNLIARLRADTGATSPQHALERLWRKDDPHITVWPQQRMNAYPMAEYGFPEDTPGNWAPGDFILHTPGLGLERREHLLRHALNHH